MHLHPLIPALPKWTSSHPKCLLIGDCTIIIPPYSGFSPTVMARTPCLSTGLARWRGSNLKPYH